MDEGDRNTYTWKGKLVKDCNEEPMRNIPIYLEVSKAGVPTGKVELLAETTTDNEGNFSMTYRKTGGTDVAFYVSDGGFSNYPLLNSPVNQDVYRNIALEDCFQLYFDVKNLADFDSIYIHRQAI
ncbi:MAG: hypothetical protein Salg2KO_03250 [Salibacteraceae bacterium]